MRDFTAWRAWITAREQVPFGWGRQDCVSFAAGAVRALTGCDPLAGIACWRSRRAALAALAARGGLAAAVDGLLDPVAPVLAARGDVGMIESGEGPLLVVVEGLTLVGPGLAGLRRVPRAALLAVWDAESVDRGKVGAAA